MALKAGIVGLCAGSSWLIGGLGQAFAAKSIPFSGYCGVPLLRSPGATREAVQLSING